MQAVVQTLGWTVVYTIICSQHYKTDYSHESLIVDK